MSIHTDLALSTRIRLARNLRAYPFPNCMTGAQREELSKTVTETINADHAFMLAQMAQLPIRERKLLVERHLISPGLAAAERGSVLISKDETLSIMIGEEDHLRIQCLLPGLQLEEADRISMSLDEKLSETLEYAFDAELGYLTACPTNVGSGMRASVMLHLPALALTGQVEALLKAVSKLGYAVRGIYGEGSSAPGHIYQISNQVTLGILEEDIISNLTATVKQVMDREEGIRATLQDNNRLDLEDLVYRSLGILRYARKLNTQEAMEHISNLKLGCGLHMIAPDKQPLLNRLLTDVQSASLEQRAGKELSAEQHNEERATLIREAVVQLMK